MLRPLIFVALNPGGALLRPYWCNPHCCYNRGVREDTARLTHVLAYAPDPERHETLRKLLSSPRIECEILNDMDGLRQRAASPITDVTLLDVAASGLDNTALLIEELQSPDDPASEVPIAVLLAAAA